MNDLEFNPVGKVKLSRCQYWKYKAFVMRRVAITASISMFVLGLMCGSFLSIYL